MPGLGSRQVCFFMLPVQHKICLGVGEDMNQQSSLPQKGLRFLCIYLKYLHGEQRKILLVLVVREKRNKNENSQKKDKNSFSIAHYHFFQYYFHILCHVYLSQLQEQKLPPTQINND